jgi:hypothetical protein
VRLADDRSRSPYFKGAAAMSHRHALAAADGASLEERDPKANWPQGYRPAAYRASGVERFAGWTHRAARYFSEVDARPLTSRLVAVVFCLSVFTMYGFTRRLWNCQAAGFIAAGVVGLLTPLVHATDGGTLSHLLLVLPLVTIHALLLLRAHREQSTARGVAAGVACYLVIAGWELGLYYCAAAVGTALLAPAPAAGSRRWTIVAHAAAALLACVTLYHLRELRAAASWPVVFVVIAAAGSFAGGRIATRRRLLAMIVGLTVLVSLALTPIRSGAAASLPAMEWVWYRIRFLLQKPASPALLPPEIRELWSFHHAPPSRHQLLAVLLPMAFFVAAAMVGARNHLRRHPVAFLTSATVAALAALCYFLDRSALIPAVTAMAPLVALAGRGLSAALPVRGTLLLIGVYLSVAQLLAPLGAANPVFQIAKAGGFSHQDPHRFLWVSMENTDRQLVGFVASRTSTRDPILGSPEVTALLLAFAGRTSVPLPGALWRADVARNAELARLLYQDESALHRACNKLGVRYVLYSIDYLLDTTRNSPAYLAGQAVVSRESAAFRMHFEPEGLRHFTLVYENEHYRLFRVTERPEPMFLTDHPIVYQRDAFERAGGEAEAFRQRVLELVLRYRLAMTRQAAGDFNGALDHLSWCLQEAPGFTLARVGVGATLIQAGRLEEARDVLLSVIGYAPDNTHALYHAAYVLAALDESTRALEYLDVFFSVATDPDLIERARLLKTFIDQGVPVTPGTLGE